MPRAAQVANERPAPAEARRALMAASFNRLITNNENVFEGSSWCLGDFNY